MKKRVFILVNIIIVAIFLCYPKKSHIPEIELQSNDQIETTRVKANQANEKRSPASKNKVSVQKKLYSQKNSKSLPIKISNRLKNKNRRPSSFENFFNNDMVTVNERNFYVSEDLRTIPFEEYDSSFGNIVSKKAGYIFFESNNNINGQPALYNKSNKSSAVLTGRILLRNISHSKAEEIANKMQTNLDTSMAHLGVYAIKVQNSVLQTVKKLGKSICSAEIIEGQIHEK